MLEKLLFPSLVAVATLSVVALVSVARADTFGTGGNAFDIDFVPISASTNPTVEQANEGALDGFGIVNNDYRMGVYEITNAQWNKFEAELGVPVTGAPSSAYGGSFHDFGTGMTNVPANNVSWYEAAQFVNWLNTSKGHPPAYKFTGTQGTIGYTFATWAPAEAADGTSLSRHKDAFYFLPTEDEWVKAAAWNGTTLQPYATKDGELPAQGDGTSGTGWNCYDYYTNEYATVPPGPWNVGSGSEELKGTFDMMGNVFEWTESMRPLLTGEPADSGRVVLGGSWWAGISSAVYIGNDNISRPADDGSLLGFRVASVPEPGSITLLLCGLVAGLIWWRRRK